MAWRGVHDLARLATGTATRGVSMIAAAAAAAARDWNVGLIDNYRYYARLLRQR